MTARLLPEILAPERESTDQVMYAPTREVCKRYRVSRMTLLRWRQNVALAFPAPIRINGRLYFREEELVAWERDQPRKE